jgi:hypothetical protein
MIIPRKRIYRTRSETMATPCSTGSSSGFVSTMLRIARCLIPLLLLCGFTGHAVEAQQTPRRMDMLQLVRPVSPKPVSQVERLRQDIIQAINPRTGKIDPRVLDKSPGPSLKGPGWSMGGAVLDKSPGPTLPGPGWSPGGGVSDLPPGAKRQ